MADFGSVLRGLGSVLNPQVAQEVAAEDRQKNALGNQLGLLALKQKMEQASPEYQAKIQALQNDKDFRSAIAQAAGDPAKMAGAAVQYGKPELAINLYNQQESRAARLQQAHEALEARRQDLALRLQDKALDRESKNAMQAALLLMRQQGQALQAQIASGNQELKKMQFQMTADQNTRKQVTALGGALERAKLPEADAVLGEVEDSLQKNPAIAEYISGPKSALPDWMVPDDVKFGRQAFSKLFNITLRDRSGAAVTNQELDRLKQEFATGAFKTPQQLHKAVDQARDIINKHYASVASGFGPDILKAYNENIRGLGWRVVLQGEEKPDPLGIR